MSARLYLGNLASQTTVADLETLFEQHSLPLRYSPLVRKGFAFVDCQDNETALRALHLFSGKVELHGVILCLEHSVQKRLR
uniref:RRM domain-containing protein n=1 Tax=Eptatretus burgeri TaxID=7764 RepID=A0A8C4X0F2_EPTBU